MSNHPVATKASTCLACGNNPTSHLNAKIDTLLFMILNPVMQWILRTPLGWPIVYFIRFLFHCLLFVGERFGFMCFVPVIESTNSMRGDVLAAEAKRRGYTFEILMTGKRKHDTYRVTIAGKRPHIFTGVPHADLLSMVTSGWIDDKWLLKQRLMQYGVTVSRGRAVYTLRGARKVFAELQKPVIVKPRFGSRGRHTTTNITSLELLELAFKSARQLSFAVIVEEHLVGSVYRGTCIDGRFIGNLAGDPPRITGDGVLTIEALITKKNVEKPERVGVVKITDKLLAFIKNQGYTLATVLPAGQTIDLSEKIGLSYGGSSREVTSETHPLLRAELDKAAQAVGDPIIGFDFISPDITADPATVRWGIIECNSVPFINLHHDPLEGEPVNAAGYVFDYLERHLKPASKGHIRASWLYVAAAIFFAFIPLLWYVPHFMQSEPVLFGQVLAVDGDTMIIKMQKQETLTVVSTASTSAFFVPDMVGKRVMFTIDGVRDERRELWSLEVLPERRKDRK